MPKDDKSTGVVTIDEYQRDKEEFEAATDALLEADPNLSDEELNKVLDDKLGKESDETAGDAKRDLTDSPDKDSNGENHDIFEAGQEDGATNDQKPATKENKDDDSDDTVVALKARVTALESELQKERQKTSSWDGRIRAANAKAEKLQAENDQLKADLAEKQSDPDKESDEEILKRFRDDFPELGPVVDVLDKRISKVQPRAKVVEKEVAQTETDSGDSSTAGDEVKTTSTHLETIQAVHPDLSEMVSSGVLLTWINKQKPFMKPHLEDIYYKGTAQQVIDMCTQFKESTGWKSQLDNQNSDASKARQKKLDAMKEVKSDGSSLPTDGPDMSNFDQGAKDAGL